jgi:hypothetical protein
MGLLLNFVASILILCFQIICSVVGIVLSINKNEFNSWQLDLAYAKDVFGNVLIKYVANAVLIKANSLNKFGNPKQTISYVIGMNKYSGTLLYWGSVVDGILDFFDPGHSLIAAGYRTATLKGFNKMLGLYISGGAVIVFGIIYQFPHMEWALYPMLFGYVYPLIIGVAMLVFAFIINPIRNRK